MLQGRPRKVRLQRFQRLSQAMPALAVELLAISMHARVEGSR